MLFASAPGDVEESLRRMARVFGAVEANAATPVDANHAFYEGALPAMLRQLDPHSIFFTPGQFDQLRDLERSTSKGFGTVVSILPGRVIILQTMEGTPSARAGLLAGDEVVAVNGIRLDWLTTEQLVGLLGESRRGQARLSVRRTGSPRILEFLLTPQHLDSPSVERAFLIQPGAGYVRIGSFEKDTAKQLQAAVESLGGASLAGLVIDLRNNPGGLLPAALETAALFLEPETLVFSTRGRARPAEESRVPASARPYKFPIAILVNAKTGSAAEVVSAAVQDHRRGDVIGEPTYGKGLVQGVYPLSGGSGLALTTAFYYTPNGRSLQRPLREGQLLVQSKDPAGVKPDHLVMPEGYTRLRAVLDASAAFTSFATDFVRRSPPIREEFRVEDVLLDEFRGYLAGRQIQPGVSEWSVEREWIRGRLWQEIFNLSLGVAKGDEIEARRDPLVLRALREMGIR
jgi:carboxyl-terminal processing protease